MASPAIQSATGLLSLLTEPSPPLQKAALTRLLSVVDTQWHEVAPSLPELEALAEETNADLESRCMSARVASRVYFHLEEPRQALRLALEGGESVWRGENTAYIECLVGAAMDAYIAQKQQEEEEEKQPEVEEEAEAGDSTSEEEEEPEVVFPPEKLEKVVQVLFERCFVEGNFQHALGVAMEARQVQKVTEILDRCASSSNVETLLQTLQYALSSANTLVTSKAFRSEMLQIVIQYLQTLAEDSAVGTSIQNIAAVALMQAHQGLKHTAPVAHIISKLLDGTDDDALLALQLCFDLMETGDQQYIHGVARHLPEKTDSGDSDESSAVSRSDEVWVRYEQALKVLTGGFASELSLSFLHKNSDSDPLIMQNLKKALEERGGRSSILHNCSVLTHSYLNAGTTNDAFLRNNLEWMKKASNWAKFSATASLGVVHSGHITEAMSLLEPYLPKDPEPTNPLTSQGGYAEGGSLYALGLIHGSDAASSASKRKEANDFLRNHLRSSHANQAVSHGAALGVGLTAMGSNDLEIVNELKELLYTDSAVAGEAAGIAIGLVLVGSGAGNVNNNVEPQHNEELSEIVAELKTYARETQHEKIIRGLTMGFALMNYGQEENADAMIDEMRADRDPLLRYGAQYALALAYCGTGSNKAIRILLHTAVSDVSDDVRMASVIGLAFVLYKTPERVPELVKLLLESFNPHVRYASCIAVGIAMAGTGDSNSISLLEPMLTDMTDFVRQGALIGTSLIYMQQGDGCNGRKIKSFREKITSIVSDKHQTTLTKMGAIMSIGIIDAGGRNCTFDLGSKNGFTKMTSAIGMTLWLQHWYWFPMMHMLGLAITPTFTIGLNKDLKYPKSFEIQCNSRPSNFAYPKRLEEKKEEKKKRVETVTLSITAKNKARLARKKAKEEKEDGDSEPSAMEEDLKEESKEKEEETKDDKMDVDTEETGDSEEKTEKKKREPEPETFRLSNPCRITTAQAEVVAFDLNQRYRPIRVEEKAYGVIMLTDSTPGEEEDLGTVKAPSIEAEGEADAPEPFEWTPPDHPSLQGESNSGPEPAAE